MTDGQSEAGRYGIEPHAHRRHSPDNRQPPPGTKPDRPIDPAAADAIYIDREAETRHLFATYTSAQNSALSALSILTRMAAGETIPQAPAPEVLFGALLQSAAQLLELARKRLERSNHAQADKTT